MGRTADFETRAWALGHVARGLAGPFADALAAVLVDRDTECAFLLASSVRQHALLAALDAPEPQSPESQRTLFLARRPRDQLAAAYGVVPAGLCAILQRLGSQPAPGLGCYADLVRVLGEGGYGAKLLRHDRHPDFFHIQFYASLPDWARCPAVTSMREETLHAFVMLGEALRLAGRISIAELYGLVSGKVVDRHPVAVLSKCGLDLRLPPPPIAGTTTLRPIRTTRQFLAIAKLFQNCLELRLNDALSGAKAFYVWLGAEALVVELSLVDGLWWRLSEVNGYRNLGHRDDTEAELSAYMELTNLNRLRLETVTS